MTYRRKYKLRLSNIHFSLSYLATDIRRVNWKIPDGNRKERWSAGARRATEQYNGSDNNSGSNNSNEGLLINFVKERE